MFKTRLVKSKALLKRVIIDLLSRNKRIAGLIHKMSGAIIKRKENIFVRYYPDELFVRILRNMHDKKFLNLASTNQNKKKYIITDSVIPKRHERLLGKVIRSLDEIPESEIGSSLFFIYFICDSDALPVLKKITQAGGEFIPHLQSDIGDIRTSYRFINRLAYDALKKTWSKAERISHLYPVVHENICEALELTKHIEGDYVEIGVYLGGSALTAINYMGEQQRSGNYKPRKAWLLDTYDGFNYDEAKGSADVIWAGTHKLFGVEKTKEYITETLHGTTVPFELVEGNICADNLPAGIDKIAVANIDVDLYEPTLAALKKVAEHIPAGGIIICEDAASTPTLYGAYLALREFLDTDTGKGFMSVFKMGQYYLIRM